jgi:hypothetical protein
VLVLLLATVELGMGGTLHHLLLPSAGHNQWLLGLQVSLNYPAELTAVKLACNATLAQQQSLAEHKPCSRLTQH